LAFLKNCSERRKEMIFSLETISKYFPKTSCFIRKIKDIIVMKKENENGQPHPDEKEIPFSKRLEKIDEEMGYPEVEIDRKKLNDIWNSFYEESA
jgi:hypothetical protein